MKDFDFKVGDKIRYIGKDSIAFEREKEYEILSIERGYFRVMTELSEDYLFPPKLFERA